MWNPHTFNLNLFIITDEAFRVTTAWESCHGERATGTAAHDFLIMLIDFNMTLVQQRRQLTG